LLKCASAGLTGNPDGRCTTVPFHQGRDLSPILLRQIAKDIDMTIDDFLRFR
jgi:hypothetical protein